MVYHQEVHVNKSNNIYIGNGYFNVEYKHQVCVIQNITIIKMTAPTDVAIHECILFIRKFKINKLIKEFDDNHFHDDVYNCWKVAY